jgi:hypothetical protein
MQNFIEKIGTKIYITQNHYGYIVLWNDIKMFIKQWNRNRAPDTTRVDEMIKFYKSGGYLPPIISIASLNDELVCYDGNHRRLVFNSIEGEMFYCIIDIIFDATLKDIFDAFNDVNKSVQLPLIYIEEASSGSAGSAGSTGGASNLQDITCVVKIFERNYKQFSSTSNRCRAPNFNRDSFVDNLYHIYKTLQCIYTVDDIHVALNDLNVEYSNGNLCRPHSVYSSKVLEKCKSYGLWLFIDKIIPVEHVEKMLIRRLRKQKLGEEDEKDYEKI